MSVGDSVTRGEGVGLFVGGSVADGDSVPTDGEADGGCGAGPSGQAPTEYRFQLCPVVSGVAAAGSLHPRQPQA